MNDGMHDPIQGQGQSWHKRHLRRVDRQSPYGAYFLLLDGITK